MGGHSRLAAGPQYNVMATMLLQPLATESIPAGRPGSPSTTPSLALIKFYFPKQDCLLFCPFPRHVSVVDPPPGGVYNFRLVPCFAASAGTFLL